MYLVPCSSQSFCLKQNDCDEHGVRYIGFMYHSARARAAREPSFLLSDTAASSYAVSVQTAARMGNALIERGQQRRKKARSLRVPVG
eukprot:1306464-Heterocapsa_arctica.AAC.1